jgi:hypothetical protein
VQLAVKIVIVQEAGVHAGNKNFRECLNLQRALARLGHDPVVWGRGHDNYETSFDRITAGADAILLLENYETRNWLPRLSRPKIPKVFWSVDSHCVLATHQQICVRHQVDLVLLSTWGYARAFEDLGLKTAWFPNAYPSDLIMPAGGSKTIEVGFCGNAANRTEWLSFLKSRVGLRWHEMVIGNDMVSAIRSYKIHWNRNIADDVNSRTFETLGCGTFLLTNETDRLRDMFTVGRHLETYASEQDCLDKIAYYLEHEDEREKIAAEGHAHVRLHHTYDRRAVQLLELLQPLSNRPR